MSERILSEDRSVDERITTATLAGLDQRPVPSNDGPRAEREVETRTIEGDAAPADPATMGSERVTRNDAGSTAALAARTAQAGSASPNGSRAEEEAAPLFPSEEAAGMHARWDAIQVGFVDEPRRAVEQADALVAGAMQRLAEIFAEERARLEGQWDRGDSVSTEDLRLALRRYRSFFGRVLAV